MPTATLTSKGQITLPKIVREVMGVDTGDQISFRIQEDGKIYVEPENVDLMSLKGILKSSVRGASIEDMDEAVAQEASKNV